MRQFSLLLAILALCATLVAAKPQITEKTGVRNLTAVSEPGTIARGSVFTVTGKELGPVEALKADVPYGQDLGGISVAFTAADGSAVVAAYIVSASATRIVAILPSNSTAGDYKVTVTYNGEASEPVNAKIADRNLGILTVDGQVGSGAIARIRVPDADAVAAGFLQPLRPGQTVDVEAAGLGYIETPDNELAPEVNMVEGALVVLGGVEIPITYLGRNPQKPGYDRATFVVPESGFAVGCTVTIQIKIGDMMTAKGSIPVVATADAPACVHPLGLTPEGLRSLDAGGTVTRGSFGIGQQAISISVPDFGSFDMKTESISGSFDRYNAVSLWQYMGSNSGAWIVNPVGCTLWTATETDPVGLTVEAVDAGELNIKGPGGLDKAIPRMPAGSNTYSLDLAPAGGTGIPGLPTIPGLPSIPGLPGGGGAAASGVQKGTYTLTGKGGKVVGAFAVSTNLPDPIVWTNKDDASMTNIDRGASLSFLWTGVGNPGDMATAIGTSSGPAPENSAVKVNRIFICFAPTAERRIVVPSSILQQMPASLDKDSIGTVMLQHTSGESNTTKLVAPLVDGGNTEPGTFSFSFGTMKQTTFK